MGDPVSRDRPVTRLESASPFLAAGLLILFAILAVHSSWQKSATFDENNHIAMGLGPLSGQGFILNEDHPPLANFLQAILVRVILRPEVPPAFSSMYPYFSYAENLVWGGRHDGVVLVRMARMSTVVFAVLLGFVVYLWSRRLFGAVGGLFSLSLYVLCPQILAHGRLVTTDLAHALGVFCFLFALWRVAESPTRGRVLVAGLCLGAALGMKHTALLLVPLLVLYLVVVGRRSGRDWRHSARVAAMVIGLAVAAIWGLFGFTFGPVGGGGFYAPAPAYLLGILHRFETLKEGRNFFLNGEISSEGWLAYFPLCFLYKSSVAFLAMVVLGFLLWVRRASRTRAREGWVAIVVALYLIPTMSSGMDLGLRYFLPIYPFLFLFLGGVARDAMNMGRIRAVVVVLLSWICLRTLLIHPSYLGAFNELIPPERRHHFLVDSNLDWGQELASLASFQNEHGIERIRLGYFGTADPLAYGVVYDNLPSFLRSRSRFSGRGPLKKTGVIAVSATLLQGLYVSEYYAPLREEKPMAVLAGSIFVYDFRR